MLHKLAHIIRSVGVLKRCGGVTHKLSVAPLGLHVMTSILSSGFSTCNANTSANVRQQFILSRFGCLR